METDITLCATITVSMVAQRLNEWLTMSFVPQQMPKIAAATKGSINLCCFFVADVSLQQEKVDSLMPLLGKVSLL